MTVLPARTVVRGTPVSSDHQIDPVLLSALLERFEAQLALNGTNYFENTLAGLTALTGMAEGDHGFVLHDGTASNLGVYRYDGASWSKTADLPTAFATIDISDIAGLQDALDDRAPIADPTFTGTPRAPTVAGTVDDSTKIATTAFVQNVAATKSDVGHGHAIGAVTGLQDALDGKSDVGHGHAIGAVTGLQAALDGKSDVGHGHAISAVTGLQDELEDKVSKGAAVDTLAETATAKILTAAERDKLAGLTQAAGAAVQPGVYTSAFAGAVGGDPAGLADLDLSDAGLSVVAQTAIGQVLRVSQAQVVALREPVPVRSGRVYRAQYVLRRETNSPDPAGEAVEAGVTWLAADYSAIFSTPVLIRDVAVSEGVVTTPPVYYSLSEAGTTAIPVGAAYARPYLRIHGDTAVTDLGWIVLADVTEAWPDIDIPAQVAASQAAASSADSSATAAAASRVLSAADALAAAGSASTAETARTAAEVAAIAAGAPLYDSAENGLLDTTDGDVFIVHTTPGARVFRNEAGSAAALGWLGEVFFDSVTTVLASSSTFAADTIIRTRTEGIAYKAVASGGHVTNAGGQELEVLQGESGYNIKAFGVVGDGTTDDTVAFQAALDAAEAAGVSIQCAGGSTYLVYALKVAVDLDLNGATIKQRPVLESDEGIRTFTGNSTVFVNGDVTACPILYPTADCTICNGTLDGNVDNQLHYLTAENFELTGNFSGLLTGAAVIASRTASGIRNLTLRDLTIQNVFGGAIGAEYLDSLTIERITEKGGRGTAIATGHQLVAPFELGGVTRILDSTFSSPRTIKDNGNPFILSGQDTLIMRGCVWDNRGNLYQKTPGGTFGMASKLQRCGTAIIQGNHFRSLHITVQGPPDGSLAGRHLLIANNTFDCDDPENFHSGVDGSTGIYKTIEYIGNTLINSRMAASNTGGDVLIQDNILTVDQNCVLKGQDKFIFISVNPAIADNSNPPLTHTKSATVRGNILDGGGFDGHCGIFTPPGGASRLEYSNNIIKGMSYAFPGNGIGSGAVTVAGLSDWIWSFTGNTIENCRALGRVGVPGIRTLEFSNNRVFNMDTAQPLENAYPTNGSRAILFKSVASNFAANLVISGNLMIMGDEYEGYAIFHQVDSNFDRLICVDNFVSRKSGNYTIVLQASGSTVNDLVVSNNDSRGGIILLQAAGVDSQVFGNTSDQTGQHSGVTGGPSVPGFYGVVRQNGVGAAGAASALPSQPAGYTEIEVQGARYVVPFYAKS